MHNDTGANHPDANIIDVKKIIVIVIAFVGTVVSTYLLLTHYVPAPRTSLLFRICSAGVFNCDRVNSGAYSVFLGYPLAAWGLAFYAVVLFFTLLRETAGDGMKNAMSVALLWMTGASALAVLPLFVISSFIIKAFCLYCVIAWSCNIALFVLAYRIVSGEPGTLRETHRAALQFFGDCNRNFFHILVLIASVALVAVCVMFVTAAFRQQRDLVNVREGARMEEQAIDEYIRSRTVPLDLKGLPVYHGDPKAKVSVLEYFNFDCGVCRSASPLIQSIIDRYPGKVKLYLKHYPLDGLCNRHVEGKGDGISCRASLIAMALQKSARYAGYVGHIMSKRDRLSRELIIEALKKIDVDAEKLGSYMDERTAERALAAQVDSGNTLGIQGTPTFVINGKALPSGLPPARFLDRVIRMEVDRAYGTK